MMETVKNTLCFTLAGLTLAFVIAIASIPEQQGGPFPLVLRGYATVEQEGLPPSVAVWHIYDNEMCVTSTLVRRDPTECTWVDASRVTSFTPR